MIAVLALFLHEDCKDNEEGEVRCSDNPLLPSLKRGANRGFHGIVDRKIREHTIKPKNLSRKVDEEGVTNLILHQIPDSRILPQFAN